MQAGKLRHRVTLQEFVIGSPAVNAIGEPAGAWAEWATVYAAVEPMAGRELLAAQQISAETTGRIRIRYREGVTEEMRVVFGSLIYDITGILDPEERHIELVLYTKQGVNDG